MFEFIRSLINRVFTFEYLNNEFFIMGKQTMQNVDLLERRADLLDLQYKETHTHFSKI